MADFEYTIEGNIGLMRFNRPEKMNAITYEMLNDIEGAIRTAHRHRAARPPARPAATRQGLGQWDHAARRYAGAADIAGRGDRLRDDQRTRGRC